ncbi:hypothetical protein BVRB_6g144530 [Beta vulgaris subsp. vulgaris]|nr:hypothetical protein BVRB_6g144530 [Beta vulgaris subsp. vulgaris]
MDWRLVVRPGDNIPPTGHKMETDAREYLEAKRAAAQQHSASGSTPYMKDPSLRIPSRTVARSHGPSAFQPRQEKTVLQPMVYRRQALANTSSNPVLKEYRREHIPIEGQIGSLYGDQQAARECYLTTLKPSSWKEKAERPKVREDDSAEKVKGQIVELKQEFEKVQEIPLPESKPSMLLPSKKRKCLAIKEEKHSSEEIMTIMSLGLERPEPVESPVKICLRPDRPEKTLKIGFVVAITMVRKHGRTQSSNEPEAHEEPAASEVMIDTMGLTGLNREQKLGLLDGFREMMGRAGLLGMLDYTPRTYKRCVSEFLSTLTLVKHRGDTRIRFRMHDRVLDISMSQVKEAFSWVAPSSDNPFVPMGVPSEEVGTFWYRISGLPLSSGGEKISSIRHPGLRMAAYFLGMTIFCNGETEKLNQLEMCYLRALLLGSVGISDWADLWLESCIDVRTKMGGHLSMGGMITHLITRLGYPPNNACDPVADKFRLFNARTLLKMNMLKSFDGPPFQIHCGDGFIFLPWAHFPFGPTVADFFIRPEVGGGILDEMDEDDEGDGDYDMEMEQGEGSRLSSIEEQLQALTLQGNATMGYMRHLDAFFQQQYGGSYVPYGDFPGGAYGSGASVVHKKNHLINLCLTACVNASLSY